MRSCGTGFHGKTGKRLTGQAQGLRGRNAFLRRFMAYLPAGMTDLF